MPIDYAAQLGSVDPQIVDVAREVGTACLKALGREPQRLWGWNATPDHNNRRCIDFMVYSDKELGDFIAKYIYDNQKRLGLYNIIWYQRIYATYRSSEGWRAMGDRGNITQNHMDHPHVNFQNLESYTPPTGTPDPVPDDPGGDPVPDSSIGKPTPGVTEGEFRDAWILHMDKGLMFHYEDGSTEFVPEKMNGRFPAPRRLVETPKPVGTLPDPDVTVAPGGKGGVRITPEMIEAAVAAVGGSLPTTGGTATEIAAQFNNAVDKYFPGILTTKKRAACLIGQCAQETAGFRYMAEIGGASTEYAPWYGRGYVQLTWGENYQAFGKFINSKDSSIAANYFYSNPESVATKQWAAVPAVWYFAKDRGAAGWDSKSLFEWCDTASTPWTTISKGVNCGNPKASYTGYGFATRTKATDAVLAVTPEPVAPKETTTGEIKPVNDYPWSKSGIDPGNWYGGQCVSFCGWRVRSRLGIPKFHNWWGGINFGNANTWVAAARYTGVPVLTTPKVNTMAVRMSGGGGAGHVAHVIEVNADGSFDIEDMNGAGNEMYAYRPNRAVGSFDYFLDFLAYAQANPNRLDR